MTVLHLPLEIDPEVYPELYAMLVGLRSDAARVERLRQLAATGLVWETVRRDGYPKTLELPPAAAPPPRPESYVDLAIDAPKSAEPDLAHEVEIAVRELPVLHDVIDMAPPLEPDPEPPPPHEPGGDVIHMPPIASLPATRSRLKRMKQKGLFKNG